jgi:hypothetical protein
MATTNQWASLKPARKAAPTATNQGEDIVSWYPGWDSLDSVRNWHTVFEISGIVFLALLVGAEILAFQYGHRKDLLTAIAESSADAKRKVEADAAEARHEADVEGVQKQLAEANQKVAELDKLWQPRKFTSDQKAKLIASIRANPNTITTFVIKASAAADDARGYADEIAAAFNGPEISGHVRVDNAMIMGPDAFGILVRRQERRDFQRPRQAAARRPDRGRHVGQNADHAQQQHSR